MIWKRLKQMEIKKILLFKNKKYLNEATFGALFTYNIINLYLIICFICIQYFFLIKQCFKMK